jgi:hypothetical protein
VLKTELGKFGIDGPDFLIAGDRNSNPANCKPNLMTPPCDKSKYRKADSRKNSSNGAGSEISGITSGDENAGSDCGVELFAEDNRKIMMTEVERNTLKKAIEKNKKKLDEFMNKNQEEMTLLESDTFAKSVGGGKKNANMNKPPNPPTQFSKIKAGSKDGPAKGAKSGVDKNGARSCSENKSLADDQGKRSTGGDRSNPRIKKTRSKTPTRHNPTDAGANSQKTFDFLKRRSNKDEYLSVNSRNGSLIPKKGQTLDLADKPRKGTPKKASCPSKSTKKSSNKKKGPKSKKSAKKSLQSQTDRSNGIPTGTERISSRDSAKVTDVYIGNIQKTFGNSNMSPQDFDDFDFEIVNSLRENPQSMSNTL